MWQYLLFAIFILSPLIVEGILPIFFKRKRPLKIVIGQESDSVKDNNWGEFFAGFFEILGEIHFH